MENKNLIVILLLVIIAVIAVFTAMQFDVGKENVEIVMPDDYFLKEGDSLKFKLKDSENKSISNKTLHIKLINKKGKVDEFSVQTNEKGNAKFKLSNIDSGKYKVNVTFDGDEKYKNASDSMKIKIEKEVTEVEEPQATTSTQQQSSSSSDSYDDGIVDSREFYDDDIAGGQNVEQNTYENGDFEHYYEDGSYDYYDVSTGKTYYRTADGEYGVDDPAEHFN